jgi:hypothetical protein
VEVTGCRIVEIRDGRLHVNGRAVYLNGFNRHEIDSNGEHTVSFESNGIAGRDSRVRDVRVHEKVTPVASAMPLFPSSFCPLFLLGELKRPCGESNKP